LIVVASIELMLTRLTKLRVWKGVIGAKVIYDAFKGIGLEPTFSFKVSIPEKLKPELKEGSRMKVTASFWGPEAEEAVSMLVTGLSTLNWAVPVAMKVSEVEIKEPPSGSDEPVATFFLIDHGPTFYRFHGAWVPLPSARRLVLSAFKRISEASEYNMKDEAERIAGKLEVVGGKPKFAKYRIHMGEEVPAFSGIVKYYGVLEEREAELLAWALSYAPYLGLGANPGLGFGDVKRVRFEEAPFETPVRKWVPSGRTSSES